MPETPTYSWVWNRQEGPPKTLLVRTASGRSAVVAQCINAEVAAELVAALNRAGATGA